RTYGDVARIAPDGNAIVYSLGDSSGRRQLWLRTLDSEEPKPIPGTDDAMYPFWSPDGRRIGFYAQSKLKTIARDGSNPLTLAALTGFDGNADWSSTGQIVYLPGNRTPF